MSGLFLRDLASGSVAGMATTLIVTPLDTARTRLQVINNAGGNQKMMMSGWEVLNTTRKQEGIRALYKGMSAPLCAQAMYKMTIFCAFGLTSRQFEQPPSYPPVGFACGAFAGLVNSFVVTPVELVRNKLAIQRGFVNLKYSGPLAVLRSVPNTRELFRGLTATMTRDFWGMGMWFASFHFMRHKLTEYNNRERMMLPQFIIVALSGASAGVAFWTIALPFDSIKTKMQTQQVSFTQAWRSTIFLDQYRALYTLCLVRGIPAASITFSVQTLVSSWIDNNFIM